jgi:hypothetical protein
MRCNETRSACQGSQVARALATSERSPRRARISLPINSLEIYTEKSRIPDIGSDGWGIPSSEKVGILPSASLLFSFELVDWDSTPRFERKATQ